VAIHTHDGETRYVGAVLADREENGYDDSDFYAVVWTGEALARVTYASTRYAGGGRAVVDATPETLAVVAAWLRPRLSDLWDRDNREAAAEVRGSKRVRVVKGRKVPKGTEGVVGYVERQPVWNRSLARQGYTDSLATLDADNGTRYRYVNVRNLEVLDPSQYLRPVEEREAFLARVLAPDAVESTAVRFVVGGSRPGWLVAV
jgi:hypothetical protein